MPRYSKIGRYGAGIRQRPSRCRTIVCRNPRADALPDRVYTYRVGGAVRVLIVGYHLRQVECYAACGRQRRADVTGCVADHEAEFRRGCMLGGEDEVAFVFAEGVV